MHVVNVVVVVEEGYVASRDDLMRARVRTSGIIEQRYQIDRAKFVMFDVGGQVHNYNTT